MRRGRLLVTLQRPQDSAPRTTGVPMNSAPRTPRTTRQARRWGVVIGAAAAAAAMIAAAVIAAAMIAIGAAYADTTDDVIDQAVLDLNQGAAALDAAPTAYPTAKTTGG